MRYESLHVGDLVCLRGLERMLGVIANEHSHNVYGVWWFANHTLTLCPMGILKKIRRIT
jgi:hypothetical protein